MNRTGLSLLFFILSTCMFAQQDGRPMEVYMSQNQMEYVVLMPNNNFAFVKYDGRSPHNAKPRKKPYPYRIIEQGTGKYRRDYGKLYLNFEMPDHAVDSLVHQTMLPLQTADSIDIRVRFHSFLYNEKFAGELILEKMNDSVSFRVGKNQIPLLIEVKGGYPLEITETSDQVITLYLNQFKMHTRPLDNKVVDLDQLIRL